MNAIVVLDPATAIQQAKAVYSVVATLRKDLLQRGVDYGIIPGTDKPTLLKPGAERLCSALGLAPVFETLDKVERWDIEQPLFHYSITCRLVHIESGRTVATGSGSCNSMETKYRWRWLFDNQVRDQGISSEGLTTRRTKTGKLQYRVPNDEVFNLVNTIQKMACKRALIAAVLIGANASEFFTQDIEDLRDFTDAEFEVIEDTPAPPKHPTAPAHWATNGGGVRIAAQMNELGLSWSAVADKIQPGTHLTRMSDTTLTEAEFAQRLTALATPPEPPPTPDAPPPEAPDPAPKPPASKPRPAYGAPPAPIPPGAASH